MNFVALHADHDGDHRSRERLIALRAPHQPAGAKILFRGSAVGAHGNLPRLFPMGGGGVYIDRNKQTVITVQTIILRLTLPVCNFLIRLRGLIFFTMTAQHGCLFLIFPVFLLTVSRFYAFGAPFVPESLSFFAPFFPLNGDQRKKHHKVSSACKGTPSRKISQSLP